MRGLKENIDRATPAFWNSHHKGSRPLNIFNYLSSFGQITLEAFSHSTRPGLFFSRRIQEVARKT
jgi:hypothetical protein